MSNKQDAAVPRTTATIRHHQCGISSNRPFDYIEAEAATPAADDALRLLKAWVDGWQGKPIGIDRNELAEQTRRYLAAQPQPPADDALRAHPRTYSLVGTPHLFLVTDDESGINIGYANKIGGPLVAPRLAATPAAPPLDVERLLDRVLLEAAHYNIFQGKVAHANLRMILDAVRNGLAEPHNDG